MINEDGKILRQSVEWRTVALALVIYAGWGALTFYHASLPFWALVLGGAWFTAWHGSLQHEVMHGHPTRRRAANTAFAFLPLALWLPYVRYRQSHLRHHLDERLTDPLDDPESYYWTQAQWQSLSRLGRALVALQSTLLGRMLLGPLWSIARFLKFEALGIMRGDRALMRVWALHTLAAAAVLFWVIVICGMPLWQYLLAFVYAGTALSLVRSFAEHKADSEIERRTAIVENSWVFGILFLFNNLHVAHHMRPTIPWYELSGWYARNRQALAQRNGGLVYSGYRDVFRRFFLRPYAQAIHPHIAEAPPPAAGAAYPIS
jgi:fatty acid desaturase